MHNSSFWVKVLVPSSGSMLTAYWELSSLVVETWGLRVVGESDGLRGEKCLPWHSVFAWGPLEVVTK